MTMPQFTAGLSLYKNTSSYRRGRSGKAADGAIVPAGPVGECACCIFQDKYSCCASCVETLLDLI